ncbi:hypothetical protein KL86DES1_21048 [uncultured Desulfovibrio sp.]|uniref:Uncharacterized protein n=1 Tax=uncultured Desulfovibrio sp. TaxID=167968 RepID=A0A212L6B4_9BACT|nr:hypothetical protein KL86DES1_21048 [uncultured Desulfovibrio sp.]VZH33947.1 conserved protein of unknown function [Desulfovibrio sp. 86]
MQIAKAFVCVSVARSIRRRAACFFCPGAVPKREKFGVALCKSAPAAHSGHMGLDFAKERAYEYRLISMGLTPEENMAHKKIERKKELARRRHRRAQRLKQRVREAKAAA